ncbi:MAG: hypothetical protein HW421_1515 [Ignavibacteria bacterium]|nr:hypothetical protein [Ignavibacteria bacterium]
MEKKFFIIIFVFFCNHTFYLNLYSQSERNLDSMKKQFFFMDTVATQQDTIRKADTSTKFTMKKSPITAILLSLALPGAGQIYTGNYWKAPIFIAGSGALVYAAIFNNNKYKNYQNLYDGVVGKGGSSSLDSMYYKLYKEFYRDNRDRSLFYLGCVYTLCIIDAYVGAHLYDFTVSDDITMQLIPNLNGGLSVSISMILNR